MVDSPEEFEQSDIVGTTDTFISSIGTTSTAIPATPTTPIEEISIRCAVDQPSNRRLEFSFDNVLFARLRVGESREEEPRGGTIKQVFIRAAGAGVTTVNYEIFMNRGQL